MVATDCRFSPKEIAPSSAAVAFNVYVGFRKPQCNSEKCLDLRETTIYLSDFTRLVFNTAQSARSINCYRQSFRFTFAGGIVPVFKAHRNSLHTVKIEGDGIEVDLGLLIESCPNVRNLHLDCPYTSI